MTIVNLEMMNHMTNNADPMANARRQALITGGSLTNAPETVAVAVASSAVVPSGRVPLSRIVEVPLTSATRIREELRLLGLPSPTMLLIYVESSFSSQPHG